MVPGLALDGLEPRELLIAVGCRAHEREPTVFREHQQQALFAEEDDTVSSYIRRERLEGCRRQLADPQWQEHSITEIAFSWGFNNAAHFARAFRGQFGMSARDFRKRALAGQRALENSARR